MTTKAELEAELKRLKADMKQPDAISEKAASTTSDTQQDSAGSAETALSDLTDVLRARGVDPAELEDLWAQVSTELDDFPARKPLLTAVAAFGLGFMLGRVSKK